MALRHERYAVAAVIPDMARFENRRARFADLIGDGMAVIPAGSETVRNDDVSYPFRQDSDFYFLTGFPEPDAVALIDPSHEQGYVLFVRQRDAQREIWDGRRAGTEASVDAYGADAAFPLEELEARLRERMPGHSALFYRLGNRRFDQRVVALFNAARYFQVRTGVPVPDRIEDPSPLLHDLRLVKTSEEIASLRTACDITAEAHKEAMRFSEPGLSEREVQATLQYVFRARGSPRDAYPPIVASGPNAVILHYTENDRVIAAGDLVLMDAGAEYQYLSADISRTFPVDGRFTTEQRAIYDVVLAARKAAGEVCRPGTPFTSPHEVAVQSLTEGMVDLGLLPSPVERAIAMGHYRRFFYHGTAHWLGMDVHDAGAQRIDRRGRPLAEGMALTIEPGLYIDAAQEQVTLHLTEYSEEEERDLAYLLGREKARSEIEQRKEGAERIEHPVPEAFRGIGVRIEDDILITESGHENLTAAVPVAPDDVEALCQQESRLPRLGPTS